MTSSTTVTITGTSTMDDDTATVLTSTPTGYDLDNATTDDTVDTSTRSGVDTTTDTLSTTPGWSSSTMDLTTQLDDVTTVATTPGITTEISPDLTTKDVQITTWDSMTTAVAKQIGGGGLSSGAVAGIVIAVLLLVVVLMALVWMLTKRRKKNPLLRVHYKNKDSYYYQENSICRDSSTSFGEGGGTVTMEMQNPVCYDVYLPNGNTNYKAGEEGVSRPPSLSAHEDALMFTMAQTNNNATLVQKENGGAPKTENGGHRVSGNGSAPRDSLGGSSLLGETDLLEEIMDTVDSMQHESDAESCEKRSIASTVDGSNSVNTEPEMTSTPEKVQEISVEDDKDEDDPPPDKLSTDGSSLHAEDFQETVIRDLDSDSPDEVAL